MKNAASFSTAGTSDAPQKLDLGERLFLWGFRSMAKHHRCGCAVAGEVRAIYRQFQVEDAVASFDVMIEAFAAAAHTAIEIHSPGCPCLSDGEAFVLRAMASAQRSDLNMARSEFERWLPVLAADWVLGPACGIASTFRVAGLILPVRDIGATKIPRITPTNSWPIGSLALH
jgi:hypothetical protein